MQGLYFFLKNGWDPPPEELKGLSFYAHRDLWSARSSNAWTRAVQHYSPAPVALFNWDSDLFAVGPSQLDELGMTLMVLIKGVDNCCKWVGHENVHMFGLDL